MISLELDVVGTVTEALAAFDSAAKVELVAEQGPAGWPLVRVWDVDGPSLWALLVVYCGGDEDQASELASLAS